MKRICPILTLATITLVVACARPSADSEDGAGEEVADTLTGVVRAWAEAYREVDPGFDGAGVDFEALIDGTGDFAFIGRELSDRERQAAAHAGVDAIDHLVGLDALAIYLHHDNPAEWLSVPEVAAIYGEGGAVETWKQLMEYAVPGCYSHEITRFSRPADSDAEIFFKTAVLGGERGARGGARVFGDPKLMVERVKKTACAIGYGSMVHAIEHVKLACIWTGDDAAVATRDGIEDPDDVIDCAVPSPATAADRSYPLTRPLSMLTRGEPRGAVKAYLDWILSSAGQCILRQAGYAPVGEVAC